MMILREVTEELELQRMRDDLTNTIVHDLRSPLSSILGSLYFLEELAENDPESPAGQALTISIRSANKLMNLVNSLLDIARLSTGQTLVELQAQRLESVLGCRGRISAAAGCGQRDHVWSGKSNRICRWC